MLWPQFYAMPALEQHAMLPASWNYIYASAWNEVKFGRYMIWEENQFILSTTIIFRWYDSMKENKRIFILYFC